MNQYLDYIQIHYLELIGSLLGFYYLYLEYKASVWLWLVGFLMTTIYVYIYAQSELYGLVLINVYSLIITLYGGFIWIKKAKEKKKKASSSMLTSSSEKDEEEEKQDSGISTTSLQHWGLIVITSLGLYFSLFYFLSKDGGSTAPVMDSIVTALSFIGLFMLAHKKVEQWLIWIIVDSISVILYLHTGLYPTAILYFCYTLGAVAGYIKWLKVMKKPAVKKSTLKN